jgi:lactoylglutathione lyase
MDVEPNRMMEACGMANSIDAVVEATEDVYPSGAASTHIPAGVQPLRIAVASANGLRVDRHFGQTDDLWIFDVTDEDCISIEVRNIDANARGDEDRRQTIYRLVADCKALLIAKIGVTPQEKLASLGVEGIDKYANAPVEEALRDVYRAKTIRAASEPIDTTSFRLLRAVLRVSDLDRSLHFYTRLLGMVVLEKHEHKKHQTIQVCLGYGADTAGMALKLVHRLNDAGKPAERSSGSHIVIAVQGISALCNKLSAEGVAIPRPPRSGDKIVACIEDPDGHRIELIESPAA